jgi:hypothetical protein
VSKMCHSLSDESTRAATVLGSWAASFPDLIPRSDIVSVFKDKSKHSEKGRYKELGGSTMLAAANSNDMANPNIVN